LTGNISVDIFPLLFSRLFATKGKEISIIM